MLSLDMYNVYRLFYTAKKCMITDSETEVLLKDNSEHDQESSEKDVEKWLLRTSCKRKASNDISACLSQNREF